MQSPCSPKQNHSEPWKKQSLEADSEAANNFSPTTGRAFAQSRGRQQAQVCPAPGCWQPRARPEEMLHPICMNCEEPSLAGGCNATRAVLPAGCSRTKATHTPLKVLTSGLFVSLNVAQILEKKKKKAFRI